MTDKQPTPGQLKKFWGLCGLYKKKHPRCSWFMWYSPDGKCIGNHPPELDLNNLFKYAVPKLESVQLAKFADTRWHAIVQRKVLKDAIADRPELALFWAIWEVFKSE